MQAHDQREQSAQQDCPRGVDRSVPSRLIRSSRPDDQRDHPTTHSAAPSDRGCGSRAAEALGGRPRAFWTAVVVTAALFAIGHYYQGPTGIVDTGISALVFGGLYVWSGRNLWLP